MEEMTSKMKATHGLNISLIVVVIVFIICHLFNPIRRVLDILVPIGTPFCSDFQAYIIPFVVVATNFNSAINFVIYTLCGRRFRRILFSMFRRGSKSKVRPVTEYSLEAGTSTRRGDTVSSTTCQTKIQKVVRQN